MPGPSGGGKLRYRWLLIATSREGLDMLRALIPNTFTPLFIAVAEAIIRPQSPFIFFRGTATFATIFAAWTIREARTITTTTASFTAIFTAGTIREARTITITTATFAAIFTTGTVREAGTITITTTTFAVILTTWAVREAGAITITTTFAAIFAAWTIRETRTITITTPTFAAILTAVTVKATGLLGARTTLTLGAWSTRSTLLFTFATSTLEVLTLTSEKGVSTQLTLQRAVEHLDAVAVAQTDLIEVLELVGQNPSRRAGIVVLEALADHAVELLAIAQTQTLAVGRVRDDEGGSLGSRAILHSTMTDGDEVGKACRANVVTCYLHGLDRVIRTIDMVLEGLQLTALGLYISEEGGIIIRPALEGEALTEGARGDTTGDEGCLDEERPRATHGIDEVRLTLPASQKQDTSGEDFAQRSLRLCCSPATLVQALTRAIECQRHLVVRDMDMEEAVGIVQTHHGALLPTLGEEVDEGILSTVADILTVGEGL